MADLTDIKRAMLNYTASLYSADKVIPDLAARARVFSEQAKRHTAIRAGISALLSEIDPLEAELAELKQPYLNALWQMDEAEQLRIQKEKRRIEAEIAAVEKKVGAARSKLDEVDTVALAELKAKIDSFNLPDSWEFTRALAKPLAVVEAELKNRIETVGRSLNGLEFDQTEYDQQREKIDHSYKAQKKAAADEDGISKARAAERVKEWRRIEASNQREEAIAGPAADRVS
jgi:peptidoglycan hydrolase CwlO-like protein